MINSAIEILENYVGNITRYELYSIEMQRSENLEDLYYLCNIADKWYVVLETDYLGSLAYAAQEVRDTFGVTPLYWLTKNRGKVLPLDAPSNTSIAREALVFQKKHSPLLDVVLAVESPETKPQAPLNPTSYGHI